MGSAEPEEIAWKAFEQARSTLSQKRQHWVVKHTSGACSVGKVMLQRKKWKNAKCPRCPTQVETTTHVWQCQHIRANEIWDTAIDELRVWLAAQRTNSAVADTICSRLKAWRSGNDLLPLQTHLLGLSQAVATQDAIGWGVAIEGRWSLKWIEIQDRHFTNNSIRRTGRRWLTALIKKLWLIAS